MGREYSGASRSSSPTTTEPGESPGAARMPPRLALTGWEHRHPHRGRESERAPRSSVHQPAFFIDCARYRGRCDRRNLLVTECFSSLEEVALRRGPEGSRRESRVFDADVAAELQARARAALERRDQEYRPRYTSRASPPDLRASRAQPPAWLVTARRKRASRRLTISPIWPRTSLLEILAASHKGGSPSNRRRQPR